MHCEGVADIEIKRLGGYRHRKSGAIKCINHHHVRMLLTVAQVQRRIAKQYPQARIVGRQHELIAEGKNMRVNLHRRDAGRWQVSVAIFCQRSTAETEHQDVPG